MVIITLKSSIRLKEPNLPKTARSQMFIQKVRITKNGIGLLNTPDEDEKIIISISYYGSHARV